jgi:deoxyribose-phosphate aldolase
MTDADLAHRALRLLDLTDLSESSSDQAIDSLCRKARARPGPAAAVCVWPQFVSRARRGLQDSPVRIATVANFPAGGEDVERVIGGITGALDDGAHEIDLVMPYRALLRGEAGVARDMIAGVRDIVGHERRLKVILETGALGGAAAIEAASRLAIDSGADFLKTSTGKTAVSATPEAAEAVLQVIAAADRPVGFKASGGLKTLADARLYLDLADRIMGPGWATPATFRFGASGLYDVLAAAIPGAAGDAGGSSPR